MERRDACFYYLYITREKKKGWEKVIMILLCKRKKQSEKREREKRIYIHKRERESVKKE